MAGARIFGSLVLLGLSAVAASCSQTPASAPTGHVINLVDNDWLAAKLDNAVAAQLLQGQLGYTVVQIPAGTADQFVSLASGQTHASLELWPAGHYDDMSKYIDTDHSVEDGGPLGPLAKDGWFVPSYLLDDHPELATWDGLKTPANVTMFSTPATSPRGRFMGGDPSWVESDQQILDNLGLLYTVELAGSEDAEIAALQAAYARHEPILFYFWYPHWVMTVYDLTAVELPPYSAACWETQTTGGVDCSYPTQHLTKLFWSGLKDYAPGAYRFLKAFNYPTKAQLDMMSDVELMGRTIDEAAAAWIAANPTVWQPWVDAARAE